MSVQVAHDAAYDHVQRGGFHYLLHGTALVAIVMALVGSEDMESPAPALAAGALMEFLALSFAQLRLADRGDHLLVAFGPLTVIRKRVPYSDLVAVTHVRSLLIQGWGIHWVPGRGWLWNIWGRNCARLELTGKRQFTVGPAPPQSGPGLDSRPLRSRSRNSSGRRYDVAPAGPLGRCRPRVQTPSLHSRESQIR